MKIQEIDINKIKPDPNQPRKSFEEDDIKEMAQSIITEGLINPIEVDEKFVIITGERRWRACKEAGLKKIQAKVLKMGKKERFLRQVIENIHHNTMTDWDTALALKKLVEEYFRPPKILPQGGKPQNGITWLNEITGKSVGFIAEKFDLLKASGEFQDAIKNRNMGGSFIRIINSAPDEFKDEIERKVLDGQFKTRDAGMEVVGALKRNPSKAKEILAHDYSKYRTTQEVSEAVSQFAPRLTKLLEDSMKPPEELAKIVDRLVAWLSKNKPEGVGKFHIRRIISNLNVAKEEIERWLGGE